MNRRGFLGACLAAFAAPAVIRSGILMPVRSLVLPSDGEVLAVAAGGNTLLTIDMITREALRILHKNVAFIRTVNNQYNEARSDRIIIRRAALS